MKFLRSLQLDSLYVAFPLVLQYGKASDLDPVNKFIVGHKLFETLELKTYTC